MHTAAICYSECSSAAIWSVGMNLLEVGSSNSPLSPLLSRVARSGFTSESLNVEMEKA